MRLFRVEHVPVPKRKDDSVETMHDAVVEHRSRTDRLPICGTLIISNVWSSRREELNVYRAQHRGDCTIAQWV